MSTTRLPADLLESAKTQTGQSLGELARQSPVLVVFLRHCGCTFAREALTDVAAQREKITSTGTKIVVVHMQTEEQARDLFARYRLMDIPRISDPDQRLYNAFEVGRGSLWQVAGPANWWAGLKSVLKGHTGHLPTEDVWQLPGAFLIHNGEILNAFRGQYSSDRPDYVGLTQCSLK